MWFSVGFYFGIILALLHIYLVAFSNDYRKAAVESFDGTVYSDIIDMYNKLFTEEADDMTLMQKLLAALALLLIVFIISILLFLISWLLSYILIGLALLLYIIYRINLKK